MSTLRATNIKNESSASNNIVLDVGGGVVVSGVTTVTAGSASAPSISPSGDSNTGIFFPAADTIAFSEGGVESLRIDSSGRLLVGTNTARSNLYNSNNPLVQFETTGNSIPNNWAAIANRNDAFGPELAIGKSRGTAVNSVTAVQSGDSIGGITFLGADGTTLIRSASIYAEIDGTPGANDMPGRLVFSTTADGASSSTERMRIDSQGRMGLGTSSVDTLLHLSLTSAPGNKIRVQGANNTDLRIGDHALINGGVYINSNATNQDLRFQTQGTDRVTINSTGMGVGTASPQGTLDVSGTGGKFVISPGPNANEVRLIATNTAFTGNAALAFTNYTSELARFDTSGRLLIGTSSARANMYNGSFAAGLQVESTVNISRGIALINNSSSNEGGGDPSSLVLARSGGTSVGSNTLISNGMWIGNITFQGNDGTEFVEAARVDVYVDGTPGANDMPGRLVFSTTADGAATPTERMRVDNKGCLMVGTTDARAILAVSKPTTLYPTGNASNTLFTGGGAGNGGYGWSYSSIPGCGAVGNGGGFSGGAVLPGGYFVGCPGSNVTGAGAGVYIKGGSMQDGGLGQVGAGIYAEPGTDYAASTTSNYAIFGRTYSYAVFGLDRRTSDGTLFSFQQDGTEEGSISVSGTTVSYNGAHLSRWSQLINIDAHDKTQRPEILRGTVMSNLDEMCQWIDPETGEEQDNEQLNKTQISTVEDDPNVAGVFQSWDDDDDTWVNDYYLAMTGDFIIRIAADTTVSRGDLLISAGDGTAKPQGDRYLKDSTIAKVTSTNVTCTYEDGSYCVPCVLMAC